MPPTEAMDTPAGAWFSSCGAYRHGLWRNWGAGNVLAAVLLNPSTAGALTDDPTIRQLTAIARHNGCTGIRVYNLFQIRSAHPAVLRSHPDPVGPDCPLLAGAVSGMEVVCAWGSSRRPVRDVGQALRSARRLWCLGTNRDGQPRHPLFCAYYTRLVPYTVVGSALAGRSASKGCGCTSR